MPAQFISQPNPPPDPSLLPDTVLDYAVKLDTSNFLSPDELNAVQHFRRAADYIAAGKATFGFLFCLLTCLGSNDLPQR